MNRYLKGIGLLSIILVAVVGVCLLLIPDYTTSLTITREGNTMFAVIDNTGNQQTKITIYWTDLEGEPCYYQTVVGPHQSIKVEMYDVV